VRVSVIDNGRGIAAEDQAKIFDKFVQLDGGHTREHSGTGLGLAICKELAGVLHAELQVVSELGRGSMFSVILPLSIEGAPARESELESKFRGALSRE
jgi:signal transduction histidine kinase